MIRSSQPTVKLYGSTAHAPAHLDAQGSSRAASAAASTVTTSTATATTTTIAAGAAEGEEACAATARTVAASTSASLLIRGVNAQCQATPVSVQDNA